MHLPLPIGRAPRRSLAVVVVWLALSLAASPICAAQESLPDLGDPSLTYLSSAQERKLGESIVRQIRASGAYLNDPEVNGYLNDLGNRLVTAIPGAAFDFEFFAVNDPSVNAFALPGGFIGVNTGTILLTQTESELASVLGHEITHVTQHHIARSILNQRDVLLTSLAALAAAVLAARSRSNSSGDVAQAAMASAQGLAIQSQINFTRQNEEEADRLGFERTYRAGFDPNAMASFFERLQRTSVWFEGYSPTYFHDHPETYQRIAEAQARAYGKPFRQVPDSLDFQMVRALLKSYEGTPTEAIAFFRDAIAERKFNSEVAAHYGLVASLLRAEDFTRAQKELLTLEKIAPPHPMVEGMAGQVLMQSGQLQAAITRYEAALVRYPRKLQLVYDYPEALLKNNQPAKAATFIAEQLQRFPNDGPLHQLAARSYAALGKHLLEHQHQGEYYAWQGDLKGAVVQLELAVKAGDGDFYQISVAESRLRAVRQELADQDKSLAGPGHTG